MSSTKPTDDEIELFLIVSGTTCCIQKPIDLRPWLRLGLLRITKQDLEFVHDLYNIIDANLGFDRKKNCERLADGFGCVTKTPLFRDSALTDFVLAKLAYAFCLPSAALVFDLAFMQVNLAQQIRVYDPGDSPVSIESMSNVNVLDLISQHALMLSNRFSDVASSSSSLVNEGPPQECLPNLVVLTTQIDAMVVEESLVQEVDRLTSELRQLLHNDAQNNVNDQGPLVLDGAAAAQHHHQRPLSLEGDENEDDSQAEAASRKRKKPNSDQDSQFIKARALTDKRKAILLESAIVSKRSQMFIQDPNVSRAFRQSCLAMFLAASFLLHASQFSKGEAIAAASSSVEKTEKAAGLSESALQHLWFRLSDPESLDPSSQRGKHLNPNACELDDYPELGKTLREWLDENHATKKTVNPIFDDICNHINEVLVPQFQVQRNLAHTGEPFSATCIRAYLERLDVDKELRKKRFADPRMDPKNIEENKEIYETVAPVLEQMIRTPDDWRNLVENRVLPSYVSEATKAEWDSVCDKLQKGETLDEAPNFVGFHGHEPLRLHSDVHAFAYQPVDDMNDVNFNVCPECGKEDAEDYKGENDPVCDRCLHGYHLKCTKLKKRPNEE